MGGSKESTVMTMPLVCWCGKPARYTRADGMPADNACKKAHMLAPVGFWYTKVEQKVKVGVRI